MYNMEANYRPEQQQLYTLLQVLSRCQEVLTTGRLLHRWFDLHGSMDLNCLVLDGWQRRTLQILLLFTPTPLTISAARCGKARPYTLSDWNSFLSNAKNFNGHRKRQCSVGNLCDELQDPNWNRFPPGVSAKTTAEMVRTPAIYTACPSPAQLTQRTWEVIDYKVINYLNKY